MRTFDDHASMDVSTTVESDQNGKTDIGTNAPSSLRAWVPVRVLVEERPGEGTLESSPEPATNADLSMIPVGFSGGRSGQTSPVQGAVHIPKPMAPKRVELLQEWEGEVLSAASDGAEFRALLRDLTESSNPEEEITLPVTEVSQEDRPLVVAGGLFYWTIGYEHEEGGQVKRFSRVRFRRIPPLGRREIEAAKREGARMAARYSSSEFSGF